MFCPNLEVASVWSEALLENNGLLHLDLSHNQFTTEELEKISEGLLDNHSLLGLHLSGNRAVTDAKGFVTAINE